MSLILIMLASKPRLKFGFWYSDKSTDTPRVDKLSTYQVPGNYYKEYEPKETPDTPNVYVGFFNRFHSTTWGS